MCNCTAPRNYFRIFSESSQFNASRKANQFSHYTTQGKNVAYVIPGLLGHEYKIWIELNLTLSSDPITEKKKKEKKNLPLWSTNSKMFTFILSWRIFFLFKYILLCIFPNFSPDFHHRFLYYLLCLLKYWVVKYPFLVPEAILVLPFLFWV